MFKKILLSFFLFYTIVGFVVVPLVLKPQVISLIENETLAKVSIEDIDFNPFIFRLMVYGVKLENLQKEELLSLKSITLNVELLSLVNGAVHISDFTLEEPKISLVLAKDKSINFTSILKPASAEVTTPEAETPMAMPRIILDKIAIIGGSLNYKDYSQKSVFEFGLDTIGFELKDIDTKNLNTDDAKLRFYMKLADGGFFSLNSEVLSLEPLIVKGDVDYEASKLYTQWRYIKDSLNLEVADGKLSLHTQYYFNLEKLEETTLSNFNVNLSGLRVKPKGNHQDVLSLKSFKVENATIKPMLHDVVVDKISLNSLNIKAKRDTQGLVDWLEYIKINKDVNTTKTEEVVVKEDTNASKPWNVLVKEVALEKITVSFEDEGVNPHVTSKLNALNIYAQNITLDGVKPFSYQLNLLVNDSFNCQSHGEISHKVLNAKLTTQCSKLDVESFLPYIDTIARSKLKVYDVKLRSLIAGFDANVSVMDINKSMVVAVSNATLNLDTFAMNKRSTNMRLLTFKNFTISGVSLNTKTKDVNITHVVMQNLYARTKLFKNGKLNVDDLIVPKKTSSAHVKKKKRIKKIKEKEYRIRLKKFELKGSTVTFEDKTMKPSITNRLDRIYVSARNIDSKRYSWLSYYMSGRINKTGRVKLNGALRHTPLKQKGKVELKKIDLTKINPYIKDKVHVRLEEGFLSLKVKTKYQVLKTKPDLNVDGSFKVENFFVNDTRDDTALVSFRKLDLKKLTLEISPNRLFVDSIDIDSFYVNAAIDANKTMNLATLVKGQADANTSDNEQEVQTIEVADANVTKKEAFPVKIMKVNVTNGSAVFADYSLPIKFKTDIHDLNGVVYTLSTAPNETSFIDIVGEVDKYGSTKLKGTINASNPKAFTDIDFNFRNLDLSAVSGYSSTFAGYKIDEGKLFLSLNYDIKESQLKGENSIIVKNIKLGEEVEIDGGSLPLGFVIALLEDSDGIIDIDMPIRGNVDEPDFKYGALVWKTFGNLILKAVTSPFRFLGAMMGIGGDDLEYAEFEGGSYKLLPPEVEKLDNIAKLLIKRPKISLSIAGGYNLDADRLSLQKTKLADVVVKLSGAKNEKEKINAMNIDLLEDIYKKMRDDNKLDKLEDALEKKYPKEEEFERAYLQALVVECTKIQVIANEEVQALASKRSEAITNYLVDSKGIKRFRISQLPITEVYMDEKKLIQTKLEVLVK
nr:DUF748 domain-containing protein [Sulfurimonas sp. SAG-AH-194-I05]